MTKHIQWDGQLSQEGFDIFERRRVAVSSALQSWLHHLTSDKAGLVRVPKPERNRNKNPGVVLSGEAWMNFVLLLNWILKLKPSTKNIGMKISSPVYPSMACEDAYAKLQAFGDGRRRTHDRRSGNFMLLS